VIQLTDNLWIGGSDSAYARALIARNIGAVLCVAQDLRGCVGWPEVEFAQVGLVDGPGNEVADYCAAILALVALVRRYDAVLVVDHDGGRALAVSLIYLNLTLGQYRAHPLAWSHWMTWDERLTATRGQMPMHYPGILPEVHPAHREAFARIPFGVLEALL
jgi:hypothetical protein